MNIPWFSGNRSNIVPRDPRSGNEMLVDSFENAYGAGSVDPTYFQQTQRAKFSEQLNKATKELTIEEARKIYFQFFFGLKTSDTYEDFKPDYGDQQERYKKIAETYSEPEAHFLLAHLLLAGKAVTRCSKKETAANHFQEALNQGYQAAKVPLTELYINGKTRGNEIHALQLLEPLAKAGDRAAAYRVAQIYAEELTPALGSHEALFSNYPHLAVEYYKIAAASLNDASTSEEKAICAKALFALGEIYQARIDTKTSHYKNHNVKKALAYFKQAQALDPSLVPKKMHAALALHLLEPLAKAGDRAAAYRVAQIYAEELTPALEAHEALFSNYPKLAIEYYKIAANPNDTITKEETAVCAQALFALGKIYQARIETKSAHYKNHNIKEALAYFTQAYNLDHPLAWLEITKLNSEYPDLTYTAVTKQTHKTPDTTYTATSQPTTPQKTATKGIFNHSPVAPSHGRDDLKTTPPDSQALRTFPPSPHQQTTPQNTRTFKTRLQDTPEGPLNAEALRKRLSELFVEK